MIWVTKLSINSVNLRELIKTRIWTRIPAATKQDAKMFGTKYAISSRFFTALKFQINIFKSNIWSVYPNSGPDKRSQLTEIERSKNIEGHS